MVSTSATFLLVMFLLVSCSPQGEVYSSSDDVISHPEDYENKDMTLAAFTSTDREGCQASSGHCWGAVRLRSQPWDGKTQQASLRLINGTDMSSFNQYGSIRCVDKQTEYCQGWKDNEQYLLKGRIIRNPNPYASQPDWVFAFTSVMSN